MKNILLTILVLFAFSCKNKVNSEQKPISRHDTNFDWILGKWARTNEKEGRKTYEFWSKKNDSEYQGLGFTIQGKDTVWKEHIRLVFLDKDWFFEVTGEGERAKPTAFKLTNIGIQSFTCENKLNEFPKQIDYSIDETGLEAVISGGGNEVFFNFKKFQ